MSPRGARTSDEVYIASAIARLLRGNTPEEARQGLARQFRWLTAEQLDIIMGRAVFGVQAGEAYSQNIEALTESPGEVPYIIVERERYAVIHVVPIPGDPRTDTRTIHVRLRPGMTTQDIIDEVNRVMDQWTHDHVSDFGGVQAWDWRVAYIL